jgi:hypothetical protein
MFMAFMVTFCFSYAQDSEWTGIEKVFVKKG